MIRPLVAATVLAIVIVGSVAGAVVTAHYTEHITYSECFRRLIHGYDREGG